MTEMKLNDILEIIKSSGHFNVYVPDGRKGKLCFTISLKKYPNMYARIFYFDEDVEEFPVRFCFHLHPNRQFMMSVPFMDFLRLNGAKCEEFKISVPFFDIFISNVEKMIEEFIGFKVERYKFYCYDSVGDVRSFDLNEVVRYFRTREMYIYMSDKVVLDRPRYTSFLYSTPSIRRIEIWLNDTQWILVNLFKNGFC